MSVPHLFLAVSRWSRSVKDIPIHLLSLPIPFNIYCPDHHHPSFTSGSPVRSHSISSQHASICLGMSLCCSAFLTMKHSGRCAWGEEIPGLREVSPPLGRQQAEKNGDWMVQLFPQPCCHPTFTLFSLLCVYQAI